MRTYLISFIMGVLLAGPAAADTSAALKKLRWNDSPPASEEPASVVGVRGLDKSKDTGDTAARDYAAVDRLEKVTVTAEELQRFTQDGKLP